MVADLSSRAASSARESGMGKQRRQVIAYLRPEAWRSTMPPVQILRGSMSCVPGTMLRLHKNRGPSTASKRQPCRQAVRLRVSHVARTTTFRKPSRAEAAEGRNRIAGSRGVGWNARVGRFGGGVSATPLRRNSQGSGRRGSGGDGRRRRRSRGQSGWLWVWRAG